MKLLTLNSTFQNGYNTFGNTFVKFLKTLKRSLPYNTLETYGWAHACRSKAAYPRSNQFFISDSGSAPIAAFLPVMSYTLMFSNKEKNKMPRKNKIPVFSRN